MTLRLGDERRLRDEPERVAEVRKRELAAKGKVSLALPVGDVGRERRGFFLRKGRRARRADLAVRSGELSHSRKLHPSRFVRVTWRRRGRTLNPTAGVQEQTDARTPFQRAPDRPGRPRLRSLPSGTAVGSRRPRSAGGSGRAGERRLLRPSGLSADGP